jgi:hypothetical protein
MPTQLTTEIVRLSEARSWSLAKLEWDLESVYFEEIPDTCLCGHFPIIEICILRNRVNDNRTIVGNICVKKFLGLPSDTIFRSVRRVHADKTKSLNEQSISYALSKRWINEWEHDFYADIRRKRNLTRKQAAKKLEVNRKVVEGIVNARRKLS